MIALQILLLIARGGALRSLSGLFSQLNLLSPLRLPGSSVSVATPHIKAPLPQQFDVVVVGGGITGLAAALALRERGARVAILEQDVNPSQFDPDRGEVCFVDGRGKLVMEQLGLSSALALAGIAQSDIRVASVSTRGVTAATKLPSQVLSTTAKATNPPNELGPRWIARETLVSILDAAVASTAASEDPLRPAITRRYGCSLEELKLASAAKGWSLSVTSENAMGSGAREVLSAKLVVGTDGMRSAVRETLGRIAGEGMFAVVERKAASSGLVQKLLKLPPSFALSADGSQLLEPSVSYSVRSAPGVQPSLQLWMLPAEGGRTAQLITDPDHPVCQATSATAVAAYLRKAFPHLPLGAAQLGTDELARFAASAGYRFPPPQHCTHGALTCGEQVGAVLAGDALHAFPPDLGQGVNAGLQDVAALASALDAHGVAFGAQAEAAAAARTAGTPRPGGLARALARYGIARAKEAAALTKLVQLGFPLQYSQAVRAGWLRRLAWRANFHLRLFLAQRIGPRLNFYPSIWALVQNPNLSYSAILRAAHATTRSIIVLFALGVLFLAGAAKVATLALKVA